MDRSDCHFGDSDASKDMRCPWPFSKFKNLFTTTTAPSREGPPPSWKRVPGQGAPDRRGPLEAGCPGEAWPRPVPEQRQKSGSFLSPTRGLVTYDVTKIEFTEANRDDLRIGRKGWNSAPIVHKVFGDAYLLLLCLKNTGMIGILREVFPQDGDYELVPAHLLCDILRNGGGIHCYDFMEQSLRPLFLAMLRRKPLALMRSSMPFSGRTEPERRASGRLSPACGRKGRPAGMAAMLTPSLSPAG